MKALLYASVDLNLIDGSSIWLASLAETLSLEPSLNVDVLARTDVKRDIIVQSLLKRPNVEIINFWNAQDAGRLRKKLKSLQIGRRLDSKTAGKLIKGLDQRNHYDVLIIRDDDAAIRVLENPRLRARTWVYVCDPKRYPSGQESSLAGIVQRGGHILCQTQLAKDEILKRAPGLDPSIISLLPPMIPDFAIPQDKKPDPRSPRLGYSGKFSPHYFILEMISAFGNIRQRFPQAEFHVLGDKFHNAPAVDGFERTVREALTGTQGVVWHGGVSRQRAIEILSGVDVACSWRHDVFNDSVEQSTKIIEYASLGLPTLMNRNPVQEEFVGSEYPCFVESQQDFVDTFARLIGEPDRYRDLSKDLLERASRFTYSRALQRLYPKIEKLKDGAVPVNGRSRRPTGKRRLLFAGHLLNFAQPLIEHFRSHPEYEVKVDQWVGHSKHREADSLALLSNADIIFCEWCLGNAVWYSQKKRPDQRLVIRLHHQEMKLQYVNQLNWRNVDALVAICPHHFDELRARFPEQADKIRLVYNLFDTHRFVQPKLEGAEFNLGFIGIVPRRKCPHLAFEILGGLKAADKRFSLYYLGKQPHEYSWMRTRFGEMKYYQAFRESINASDFQNSVMFDGFTSDVPGWFSKIGFQLSTSEHEGSHQAVAEAMAAGTIPIIHDWKGASRLYPAELVYSTVDEAVELILSLKKPGVYSERADACKRYARASFDCRVVVPQVESLFVREAEFIDATC